MPLFIDDRDTEIVLSADMPGMRRQDLSITYDDGWINISGKHANVEYSSGCFLTTQVDAHLAVAQCKDGRLTVRLPKTGGGRHRIKVV